MFKSRLFEVCQQLEYYPNYKTIIENAKDIDIFTEIAYNIHDKDILENGQPKPKHIHIMIKCNQATTSTKIAKTFGVPEQYVSKSIRGSFCKMVQYLTHKNDIKKYQYDYDSIVKVKGDIDTYYKTDIDAKTFKNYDYSIDWTFENKSYCFQLNEIMNDSNLDEKKKINALKRLKYLYDAHCIQKSSMGSDRNMMVIYMTGSTGIGKTTIAKSFATLLNYDYCVSSSSNDVMQDYIGQKCLIIDDFRPEDWKFSDLLKLLDNHTTSSVKSRYNNKYMQDCKLIIITSIKPLKDIYNDIGEDKKQLYRRITSYVMVNKDYYFIYNGVTSDGLPDINQPYKAVENPCKNMPKHTQNILFNSLENVLDEYNIKGEITIKKGTPIDIEKMQKELTQKLNQSKQGQQITMLETNDELPFDDIF